LFTGHPSTAKPSIGADLGMAVNEPRGTRNNTAPKVGVWSAIP